MLTIYQIATIKCMKGKLSQFSALYIYTSQLFPHELAIALSISNTAKSTSTLP